MADDNLALTVPEYIRKSPLVRRKRAIPAGRLNDYVNRITLLWTPEILPKFFESLLKQVQAGDRAAMRLVAEMYNFVQQRGISIVNTLIANQQVRQDGDEKFDDIIRRLEQATERTTLATPVTDTTYEAMEG